MIILLYHYCYGVYLYNNTIYNIEHLKTNIGRKELHAIHIFNYYVIIIIPTVSMYDDFYFLYVFN